MLLLLVLVLVLMLVMLLLVLLLPLHRFQLQLLIAGLSSVMATVVNPSTASSEDREDQGVTQQQQRGVIAGSGSEKGMHPTLYFHHSDSDSEAAEWS